MHLEITNDTYLKSSTTQSNQLPEEEKILIEKELTIPASEVIEEAGHYKATLYIYKGHATLHGKLSLPQPEQQTSQEKPTRTSQVGINLIKEFEGFRHDAYQDSAGVWTIGYGHTLTARPGMRISRSEGERLLRQDLVRFETAVRDRVTVSLTQNQFDALVSFAFNVGVGAFSKSTLLRLLNQGDYTGAKKEFRRWVHAGGRRLQGLVRRRDREAQLFAKT